MTDTRKHIAPKRLSHSTLGAALCLWLMLLLVTSCSTKKNTSGTRFYHSVTARFNTLYNGQVAYSEGVESQYNGHKDDYTRLLPMFVSTNKTTSNLGRNSFETAIT